MTMPMLVSQRPRRIAAGLLIFKPFRMCQSANTTNGTKIAIPTAPWLRNIHKVNVVEKLAPRDLLNHSSKLTALRYAPLAPSTATQKNVKNSNSHSVGVSVCGNARRPPARRTGSGAGTGVVSGEVGVSIEKGSGERDR